MAPKAFKANDDGIISENGSRADKTVMNLSKNNKSRNLTYMPNIGAIEKPNFLISNAKKFFNHLRLAFIKALILQHFDLESHIQIEIDVSNYAISRVLS